MVKTTIGYNDPSSTTATGQVRTWKSGSTTYTYAYDARGNITSVSDGQSTTTYAYDSFDQLVRENNQAAGKTWTYAYDDGGNILSKTEYAYTTGSLGAAVRTVTYGYGDAGWSDLLTSIGGQSLTADEIGNLLSDGTWTYTWQHGRQLAGMSKSGQTIAYGYDSDGKRITKTVNGTTYNYHYLGDQLVELTWGGNKLHFTYDSTGPLSVNCNGTEYFYVKNAQGDVTGLVSASGTRVVTYTYDAWGNPLATTGSMAATLGEQNPLRYRGYVYDTETGLYYLQSRYYNPTWGRFINADALMGINSDIGTYNLFSYCGNNPVIRCDNGGKFWMACYLLIPPLLYYGNEYLVSIGIDTAAIGGEFLFMTKDSDGVYHATFDCPQAIFGYNLLYDEVFRWATSCQPERFRFSYNGQKYVIWTWKGDYINMGAGAELGIYTGGGPQWRVDKNLAMTMYVELQYNGSTIISYSDYTWWITGFNPNYQRKNVDSLTASFAIRFKDPGMYNAFRDSEPIGWKFGLMQGFGMAWFKL